MHTNVYAGRKIRKKSGFTKPGFSRSDARQMPTCQYCESTIGWGEKCDCKKSESKEGKTDEKAI
ncbi:MAG: hypothetical protein FWB93_02840 [Oscillospiraceae bacterium]|nr:hypothetical protein [Oscillospiraceae bacterium]